MDCCVVLPLFCLPWIKSIAPSRAGLECTYIPFSFYSTVSLLVTGLWKRQYRPNHVHHRFHVQRNGYRALPESTHA